MCLRWEHRKCAKMSHSRIGMRFAELAAAGRPGFIPYVTAGYPTLDHTRDLVAGLAELGSDVIELGIPFSDPMADGPTIQRSSQGALDNGTTVDDVFGVLAELRRASEVPVVVFSYLKPAVRAGRGGLRARGGGGGGGRHPAHGPALGCRSGPRRAIDGVPAGLCPPRRADHLPGAGARNHPCQPGFRLLHRPHGGDWRAG